MIDKGAIDFRECEKDQFCKTVSALKACGSALFIDVRKWAKFQNQDEYFPRRAGLMLSIEDWKKVLPQIHELIDSVDGKTANIPKSPSDNIT